jgi:hypothetical protein
MLPGLAMTDTYDGYGYGGYVYDGYDGKTVVPEVSTNHMAIWLYFGT